MIGLRQPQLQDTQAVNLESIQNSAGQWILCQSHTFGQRPNFDYSCFSQNSHLQIAIRSETVPSKEDG